MKRGKPLLTGVCSGIANHLGLNVNIFRAIIFVLFLITGFFPVGLIYIIATFLMEKGYY